MNERQEILSKLNYDKSYREKINEEFNFILPKNEQAEQMYHALVKEQQLYLYYAVAIASLTSAFWDFRDSTRSVIHLIHEWEHCTLAGDNYESFIQVMNDFTSKEVDKELLDKWRANFSLLFAAPEKLDEGMRNEILIFLCRINAFNSLRLFFKLHYPAIEVNFPLLLKEAIGCLHSKSVQTLVEAGANVHDYFVSTALLDDGVYLFMPVIYYAVWLPCDARSALHRDRQTIFWDNPKLQNMVKTLLSLGANPEQNCLVARGYWNDKANFNSIDKIKSEENTITLAQNIITNQKNIPTQMSQESLTFLNFIAGLNKDIVLDIQQEDVEENNSVNGESLFKFCSIL